MSSIDENDNINLGRVEKLEKDAPSMYKDKFYGEIQIQ
jgi:hypothetical protein